MNKLGVQSIGIKAPLVKEGDDIIGIVKTSIANSGISLEDHDVIGITESLVARSQGNYCTVDDIVIDLKRKLGNRRQLNLICPIMSRNRFSLILRAFCRYAKRINIIVDSEYDEQGNPTHGVNPFTSVNIQEYYNQIGLEEDCAVFFYRKTVIGPLFGLDIDCRCHPTNEYTYNLTSFMNSPILREDKTYSGYNSVYGLLGSNKCGDEKLKLFPQHGFELCKRIKDEFEADVEVMIYGDGCFKDPVGGIWEFADPVTSPGYTNGLKGTPHEVKLKYIIDNGQDVEAVIKNKTSNNSDMLKQGTTPRRYVDLLASLMDLTSGSGDKGTPIVVVKNYFKNYLD